MPVSKHKVFISYHHANDQDYKESLLAWNIATGGNIFINVSVDTGDIDTNLSDNVIRQKIRDEYLRDSTVTILLVGTETKHRKHIDWEIFSSMFDGQVNKKSGILIIQLPCTNCVTYTVAHGEEEKAILYPENKEWFSITKKLDYANLYPYLPQRIIDNLIKSDVKISVANWDVITSSPDKLKLMIDLTFKDRESCNYDLSERMRRSNS